MKKINLAVFSVIALSLAVFTSCSKDDMDRGGGNGGGLSNQEKSISGLENTTSKHDSLNLSVTELSSNK